MAEATHSTEFWSEDLQLSIQTAGLQRKTLLCFVTDGSEESDEWDRIITSHRFRDSIQGSTIRLRIRKDTQAFGFLNGVCTINSTPALVLINSGQIEEKLESPTATTTLIKEKLAERYPASEETVESVTTNNGRNDEPATSADVTEQFLHFEATKGRMRLPENAYDALRERTEKLQGSKISAKNILQLQLRLLDNVSAMKPYVSEIKSRPAGTAPKLPEEAVNRLLNTPASALQQRQSSPTPTAPSTAASPAGRTDRLPSPQAAAARPSPETIGDAASGSDTPPRTSTPSQPTTQQSQRADYIRQQREREASQRNERDRIKAQIKADREERRRLDSIRKQGELATLRQENSTTPNPSTSDIRLQVRTFDGSTLRTSFTRDATITNDVRPWIDETNPDTKKLPYNLKLILTPLPNRNIEASEEEHSLPDLGIVGSATLVMVPVQGYVDSYAGSSSGVAGSVIGGLMGAGGSVVNGVLSMLGWGGTSSPTEQERTAEASGSAAAAAGSADTAGTSSSTGQVKVRTLADQRAEEAKRRGNQLYNGNSLDFQGRKDDDETARKRD